ncbi:MAG: DUF4412 domain-containing protein [Candidatus Methylomirabilia bacterium]
MRGKFAAAAVAVFSLSAALPAFAGFRIQEADLEFPQDVSVYWFQGGKARVDGALEGLTVIVDIKNGEGWLIESASKRFAGGKIAHLAEILRKVEGSLDSEAVPGDQAGKKAGADSAKPLAIAVKDLGAGERLQGYETRHFQVLLDGEVLEELWIAPQIKVAGEIDLAAFGAAMQKMLGGGAGLSQGYEESETYRNLRAGGYPLRQVLFFVGEKSTIEVTSVTVKDLPASDFAIPKGFKKIGYAELLLGEGE